GSQPVAVRDDGYTFVELAVVTALIVTISAVAMPSLLVTIDDARAVGATWYLSTRLQRARMEAIMRSADVGFRITQTPDGYAFAVYVDGNHDGLRTAEILRGVDREIMATERLADNFAGVDFGILPGLPPVDPRGPTPGSDPVKLGPGSILTFTPVGTATTGSLYILGRHNSQ